VYLNPENTVPNQGLPHLSYSSAGKDCSSTSVWPMRKAKMQMQLSQAERKLQAIAVCMMLDSLF
jgi:hypothetical protein